MTTAATSIRRRRLAAKNARAARTRRQKQTTFLTVLRRTGSVTLAARAVGVSRRAHYHWVDHDPDYAAQVEHANEELADELEHEARRRALEGIDEPVFYKGERVGSYRRYSDPLMILLLKAKRPEQFKDTVDINGRIDEAATAIDPAIMKTLTDDELQMARRLGRKLAGLDPPRKAHS